MVIFNNYIVQISLDIYYKVYAFYILLTNIFDKDISLTLIGSLASIITILFAILPIIIETKTNKNYLGFKISNWILNNKSTLFSFKNMWILSCVLIVLSVIFHILKIYVLNVLIFIVYIIIIGIFIYRCFDDITKEKHYKKIEEEFLKLVDKNRDEAISLLNMDLENDDIGTLKKDFLFLLSQNEICSNLLFDLCNSLLEKNNNDLSIYVYNKIADEIKKGKLKKYEVNNKYLFQLIKTDMDLKNIEKYKNIIYRILFISIDNIYDNINRNYYYPVGLLDSINCNVNLDNNTKNELYDNIIKLINTCTYNNKNSKESYILYMCLYKYYIDSANPQFINRLIRDLQRNPYNFENNNIVIYYSVMTYLYYLFYVESETYVSKQMKDEYGIISSKIKEEFCHFQYRLNMKNVNTMFEWITNVGPSWEVFNHELGDTIDSKTPKVNDAIMISKLSLILYLRTQNSNVEIKDEELEFESKIFGQYIRNGKLIDSIYSNLINYMNFVGINPDINQEKINIYIDKILSYSKKKYLEQISKVKVSDEYEKKINKMACSELRKYVKFRKSRKFSSSKEYSRIVRKQWIDEKSMEKYYSKDFINYIINTLKENELKKICNIETFFSNLSIKDVNYVSYKNVVSSNSVELELNDDEILETCLKFNIRIYFKED